MEFTIGTIVGVLAVILAYLTYRSQLGVSFKRIHYSSFVMPFIIPRDEEVRESLKIRYDGDELVYPLLCGAKIENTGRSPIMPSEFDGPLVIRHKGLSIFRCGHIILNRPNILDIERHPECVDLNVQKGEIHIGPTLLNPRDTITIVYIVEAVPADFNIEAIGRIAGIEKLLDLPKPDGRITLTLNGSNLPVSQTKGSESIPKEKLSIWILVTPMLADPQNMFGKEMEVFVRGTVVKDAHLIGVTISNDGSTPVEHSARSAVTLKLPKSRLIRLMSAQIEGRSPGARSLLSPSETTQHLTPYSHQIVITPPRLEPNEMLRINLIASGNCEDMTAESHGTISYSAQKLQFALDDLIEQNFAEVEPRVLLSSQYAYRLWHSVTREYARKDKETDTETLRGTLRTLQNSWWSRF